MASDTALSSVGVSARPSRIAASEHSSTSRRRWTSASRSPSAAASAGSCSPSGPASSGFSLPASPGPSSTGCVPRARARAAYSFFRSPRTSARTPNGISRSASALIVADLPTPGSPVTTTFGLLTTPASSQASGWQLNAPPVRQSIPMYAPAGGRTAPYSHG